MTVRRIISIFVCMLMLSAPAVLSAQKIESMFFNLYTDSLKKGTYNYINVDGRYTDGRWIPLTASQLDFSSSAGRFEGNSLFVDKDFKESKITVTATLRSDTSLRKSITIFIKRNEDNERLKTQEEILREMEQGSKRRRKS